MSSKFRRSRTSIKMNDMDDLIEHSSLKKVASISESLGKLMDNLIINLFKHDPYLALCDILRVYKRTEFKCRKTHDRCYDHPELIIEKGSRDKWRIRCVVLFAIMQTYSFVKFSLSTFFQIKYNRSEEESDRKYWLDLAESIGNPMIAVSDLGIYVCLGGLLTCHLFSVWIPLYYMFYRPIEAPHIRFIVDPTREVARLDYAIKEVLNDFSVSIKHCNESLKLKHYHCCKNKGTRELRHQLAFNQLNESSKLIDFYRKHLPILRLESMKDDTSSHAKAVHSLPLYTLSFCGCFFIFFITIQIVLIYLSITGKCKLFNVARCTMSTAWSSADLLMHIEALFYATIACWTSFLIFTIASFASFNQLQIIKCTRNQLVQCLNQLRLNNYGMSTPQQQDGLRNSHSKITREDARATMLETLLKVRINLGEYKKFTECVSLLTSTYFLVSGGFLAITLPVAFLNRVSRNPYTMMMLFVVWFVLNFGCFMCSEIHSRLENLNKLYWSILGENLIRINKEKLSLSEDFISNLWLRVVYGAKSEWSFCTARSIKITLTHRCVIQVNLILITAVSIMRQSMDL